MGAGGSGGEVDDLAAPGCAACRGWLVGVEGVGAAEQVVGDHRADCPGVVGVESAGRHVGQRPVDQVGEHGLDDRVAAVGEVGVDVGSSLLVRNGW